MFWWYSSVLQSIWLELWPHGTINCNLPWFPPQTCDPWGLYSIQMRTAKPWSIYKALSYSEYLLALKLVQSFRTRNTTEIPRCPYEAPNFANYCLHLFCQNIVFNTWQRTNLFKQHVPLTEMVSLECSCTCKMLWMYRRGFSDEQTYFWWKTPGIHTKSNLSLLKDQFFEASVYPPS